MVQKEGSQTSKNHLFCKFFLRREKTRRKIKHKGTLLSSEDQQTRNSFLTKGTLQKETIQKNISFL